MATFTATLTCVYTIEFTIPDSKLKACLADESRMITDYVDVTFEGMKGIEVEILEADITIDDCCDITKSNGDSYEWDGEKLAKL